ncbi:MAG: dephospho-CoA kinase [Desulfobacteraceae bacterium]
MIIAGLTGGIASGKTTVAAILRRQGARIVDADLIARQVVAPGEPSWKAIRDFFGGAVLNDDGTINRPLLGRWVFENPGLRRELEKIVHPWVRARMNAQVDRIRQTQPRAVVVQDIPLLYESQMAGGLAEVIVVYAPAVLQLQRLVRRDGIGIPDARARIAAGRKILKRACYSSGFAPSDRTNLTQIRTPKMWNLFLREP